MTVVVTGGAGFIGSHIVQRLVGDGESVIVFDDLSTGKETNLDGFDVRFVRGDLRDRDALRSALRGVDAVYHVGALPSVPRSWTDPVGSLAVNAQGTAVLVEEAIRANVQAVVYSSSSSVYGAQQKECMEESLEPRPLSPYGYSKLLGEEIALAHAAAGQIRVVALRYFNVFGPRQDPTSQYSAVIPRFISAALRGAPATVQSDGLQTRDFTYVDNVVQANLLAMQSTANAVALNVACGASISVLDLVEQISSILEMPLPIEWQEGRKGDIRHSRCDFSLASSLIGYHPVVDFHAGLRRACAFYAGLEVSDS